MTGQEDRTEAGRAEKSPAGFVVSADKGSAQIFFRSYSLIFFKCFNKVAFIIKPAAHPDLGNGIIGCRQFEACLLDPIVIQIIDRSAVCHFPEIPAEVF